METAPFLAAGEIKKSQGQRPRDFFLAAGEGFELPRADFRQCHLTPSNAAMPWKHRIFKQTSFHHVSKGFGQSYRDKGQNKGQTWAAFREDTAQVFCFETNLRMTYPKIYSKPK